jgi:ribosomal protein S18 acetylase RimI-like enzyme
MVFTFCKSNHYFNSKIVFRIFKISLAIKLKQLKFMSLHIRNATSQDIDSLLIITKACAQHMIEKKIFQWNEHYPNRAAFEQDVVRKELYVLLEANEIIGCIVISTLMDKEYKAVHWLSPDGNNLYIHRLAIHPKAQGKGYAQFLMDFAENYAIKNNYHSIRLDTFSKNLRNQKFYELRGYKKLDDIYFPKQSIYPFHCYERIL